MFRSENPNIIISSEGFSVQILGFTGLRYEEKQDCLRVNSEVLASPHGIVVYQSSIKKWDSGREIDEKKRDQIINNICRAFASRGVEVEII